MFGFQECVFQRSHGGSKSSIPFIRRDAYVFMTLVLLLLFFSDAVSAQLSFSLTEEVETGTVVGNVAKSLNIDVAEMQSRAFQIIAESGRKYFEVDLRSGVLYVNERIDREAVCGDMIKCTLHIKAMINNPLMIYRIEVSILDINDNHPSFKEKLQTINVAESTLPGARFSLLGAHDADIGKNAVKTYKLSTNDFFTLMIDPEEASASPELVLQKALDREKQAVMQLMLTAVDGGTPPRSGTSKIIINVLDNNDNSPVCSSELYKVRVFENVPLGTPIITLNATDADEGANSNIVYSLGKQQHDKILHIFHLDSDSGTITVKGQVDYELKNAYEIRVLASDKGQPPMATHCKVLVEVVDVNDNSPEISVTSLMKHVVENAKVGTAVALITVNDKDSGRNGNLICHIPSGIPFKLESNYKNYYSLVVNGNLDRETISEYNITVTATDEGNPPLSNSTFILVWVSDVNDNAPHFPEQEINMYIKENSPVGAFIKTVTAFDADANENAQVAYSLLESSKNAAPTTVNINSHSGDIYTTQTFNYEEMKMFQFRVQATDSGVPPLSSNVTVNVFILDENDNRPGILAPYSEQGSVNTESIPYSAEAGYFVAKIRAVDADSGYNALLSYHMSEPKGSNLFRIGSSNGEIRTKRRMSDNDLRTHPLVIVVCDSGEPSLSATVSVDVLVVESSGETDSFGQRPSKEESFSDLNVYLLIAIVSVCVIFVLSLIGVVAVKCHRTEEDFSSYGAPVITTHPDGSWSYSKSTQQYDVCFSSDTLKSDVVVFPAPCGPADAELISINGGDTFKRNQTLLSRDKVRRFDVFAPYYECFSLLFSSIAE